MTSQKSSYTLLSFVLILALIYIAFYSLMPQETVEKTPSKTEFSTARAFEHVGQIAKAPHYVGSKAHAEVRNYIVSELEKLGLTVEIQEGFTLDDYGNISYPKNIIAKIKGKNPSKSLVLLSHYDSDPHSSFGASDAASGVATILEGIHVFLASGKQPKNDIIILFTDGEELGLNGAELFVNKHPWAKDIGLVLNFEARGSGGPSIMLIETNQGNAKLIKAFKKANPKYPVANSLAYSIYKMLPNDTDLTVFREDGDIQGFNFAFIDDHFDYHTANDTYENLDFNTLAHQGSYLMPLLNYFSQTNLTNLSTSDELIYFNSPFGFHTYAFSWIYPMLVLVMILFIILIGYGIKKEKLTFLGIAKGFIPFLVALVASGIIGFFGWELIKWLYPSYAEMLHGFTYNGYWYVGFFVLLSVGISMYSYYKLGSKITVPNLSIAPIFFWILFSGLSAIYLPGASFIIIPVFFAMIAVFLIMKQTQPNGILLTVLAVPTIFILTPFVKLFPVGLGLGILFVVAALVVLIFGLLLPVVGFYKRKKWTARLFFLAAAIVFFVAHAKSGFTKEQQKPNSLVYIFDADTNTAKWATYDRMLDSWTQHYITDKAQKSDAENTIDSKYNSKFTYTQKAPVKTILLPKIEISKDTIINKQRHIQLCISPQRNVNRIEVFKQDFPLTTLKINGKTISNDRTNKRRLISYYVSDNHPLEIEFITDASILHPEFSIYEASYDLLENSLFSIPLRPEETMPKPFVLNDAILVKKTIKL